MTSLPIDSLTARNEEEEEEEGELRKATAYRYDISGPHYIWHPLAHRWIQGSCSASLKQRTSWQPEMQELLI